MTTDQPKHAIARDFETPAVVIDLDIVERNIMRVQKLCEDAGVANRPHIKTHKVPALAKMQVKAGARGITCRKLGEAEVMADAGLDDIVISCNLISAARSGRLSRLLQRLPVKVCADNPVTLAAYSEAGQNAGRAVEVLIECDAGRKRAGVETANEAIQLAETIKADPNLSFAGLLFYPTEQSWPETQTFFEETKRGLAGLGLTPKIVSTGGTPNLVNVGSLNGATEHRAGTYIFNDRMMMVCHAVKPKDCALNVYATVVSRAGPERGILDAGSKTLTSDIGGLDGHGLILEHPEAHIQGFAEEQGLPDLSACNARPAIGDIVRVVPNHVCAVVNMVDRLIGVRDNKVVEVFDVAARGRLV